MTYDNFKDNILNAVTIRFSETATVSISPVTKNNGQLYDALLIKESTSNITPSIYLNQYYDDFLKGNTIQSIVDSIIQIYSENKYSEKMDLGFFTDYENVKKHLFIKLINKELNQELLKTVPYVEYLDLAIIFCYYFDSDFCSRSASITINSNHLDMWNITKDTVYHDALTNTPIIMGRSRFNLNQVFLSHFDDLPLIVLTNDHQLFGATALCDIEELDSIATSMDSDLVIIPSSIHEILIFPSYENCNTDELSNMIKTINDNELQPEDILSYHSYHYIRSIKKVVY